MTTEEKQVLRARDFWTSIALIAAALFFLWKTSSIPFFNTANAGVRSADWFNSAALVPFALFGALLLCGIGLLVIAIREGGATRALKAAGIGVDRAELARLGALAIILLSYIGALVPRVDFIISSALLITALFWGFHRGAAARRWIAVSGIAAAALYAVILHGPQAEWRAGDDDWVALGAWAILTVLMLADARRWPEGRRLAPIVAVLSAIVPFLLVSAMAFGFSQNVPARSGVLFSHIEVAYYTQFRPWWREMTSGDGD